MLILYFFLYKYIRIPEYPEYPIFRSVLKVCLTWGRNYIGFSKSRSILGYLGYLGILLHLYKKKIKKKKT